MVFQTLVCLISNRTICIINLCPLVLKKISQTSIPQTNLKVSKSQLPNNSNNNLNLNNRNPRLKLTLVIARTPKIIKMKNNQINQERNLFIKEMPKLIMLLPIRKMIFLAPSKKKLMK